MPLLLRKVVNIDLSGEALDSSRGDNEFWVGLSKMGRDRNCPYINGITFGSKKSYTLKSGFVGSETFTFMAFDGKADGRIGKATMSVF